MSAAPAETLLKAIQLSVSPVFLLAGIGAMMNVLSSRLSRSVDRAIGLRTLSILLISTVMGVIFRTVALQINLSIVVAPLFVAAMLMLTWAAVCFMREITITAKQLQASLGPSETTSWGSDQPR